MFLYQSTLDTLELKKDKFADWKSKGVYTSKLKRLYTAFLYSIKVLVYRMRIKFDKELSGFRAGLKVDIDPLPAKEHNYLTEIIKFFIVYDLDALLKDITSNFKFENCLFSAKKYS